MPPHPLTSILMVFQAVASGGSFPFWVQRKIRDWDAQWFLEKIYSPTGSIFSLKTLALPTPYLFEAPETKTTEATERRIKKNVG